MRSRGKFILHNDEAPHWMRGFQDSRHAEERTRCVHGMTEDRYCNLSALWDIHDLRCKMARCFSGSRRTSLTLRWSGSQTHVLDLLRDNVVLEGNPLGSGTQVEKEHVFLFPDVTQKSRIHPEELLSGPAVEIT